MIQVQAPSLIIKLKSSNGGASLAAPTMRNDPEVQRIVSTYALGLPRMPTAGRSGELLGRGTGSSLEFQEYREYLPGDDIRHVDWAAYARADALMVRMYREEISPRTEVLFDTSKSMTTGEGTKERITRQLTSVFAQLCGRIGGQPTLIPLTDDRPLVSFGLEGLDRVESLPFEAVGTLPELFAAGVVPLKPQAVRIVLSDFLFPHDPGALVRRLAAGASALWVVQILSDWEADPNELGGRRIVDIESGADTDLLINRQAVSAYRERLGRLQQELARACRRVHAPFVTAISAHGLERVCHEELCPSGILRVD